MVCCVYVVGVMDETDSFHGWKGRQRPQELDLSVAVSLHSAFGEGGCPSDNFDRYRSGSFSIAQNPECYLLPADSFSFMLAPVSNSAIKINSSGAASPLTTCSVILFGTLYLVLHYKVRITLSPNPK